MRRVKFGFRIPSPKKRVAAFKSVLPGGARFWRHSVGLKYPRNMGWLHDPKKFAYNKVYRRTTRSFVPGGLTFTGSRGRRIGGGGALVALVVVALLLAAVVAIIRILLIVAAVALFGLCLTLAIAFFFPRSRRPILKARNAIVSVYRKPGTEDSSTPGNGV